MSKSFGAIRAVSNLDLSIEAGCIFGLFGPNGSGKTTLMRLLVGLTRPSAGTVSVLGRHMPDKSVLNGVGYMTQTSALYLDLTVRENIRFFGAMYGGVSPSRVDELLKLVELTHRADSIVATLSGGMRQRASLACALVSKPQLLLLDEPTVGVDPQLRAAFWTHFRRLAQSGTTLVVSSHVMDEAERCEHLGFMREGRLIAQGTASELRARAKASTLEEAFLKFAEPASTANSGSAKEVS